MKSRKILKKITQYLLLFAVIFLIALGSLFFEQYLPGFIAGITPQTPPSTYEIEIRNNGKPLFTQYDMDNPPDEYYAPLDGLGRCQQAFALVTLGTMPYEDRESISSVHPTGWHTYESGDIDGSYLYNRCHLIAFCLTGENANESNLVTGTRALNIDGMLPYELDVRDHVQDNGHEVLYRATPDFQDDELVCRGISLEAACLQCDYAFYVYCPNMQPGVIIDYKTGEASGSILERR